MHKKFLQFLTDPATKEDLQVTVIDSIGENIITGSLFSSSNNYPIIRGIPRFIDKEQSQKYTKSFGFQWTRWPTLQFESKNLGKPMEGHTRDMFARITGLLDSRIDQKVIADFGCGSGRFLELIAENGGVGIGLDLSDSVEAAGEKFKDNENILICQADILNSPLRNKCTDFSYSIGVLHHTPSFAQGVSEMSRSTKQAGRIAISVYAPYGYYDSNIVRLYRRFFRVTKPIFGYSLALIYSYIIIVLTRPIDRNKLLRIALNPILSYFPRMQLKSIWWSILDTFDSLTPQYQRGISSFELYTAMHESSIINIRPVRWGGTSMCGEVESKDFE